MRKCKYGVPVWAVLLSAPLLCGGTAAAGVGININVGPPPIIVAEPPEVVLIPRSEVYFVPESDLDVFFYHGWWWSPRGDRWYRARTYEGPWRLAERRYVPGPVFRVPEDYRTHYERERHIPYGQWKKEHRGREEREEYREHRHGRGHED